MRHLGDILAALAVAVAILLVAAGLCAFGVWAWRNADDQRGDSRAGGGVTEAEQDWHCVGARPEAK